MITAMRSFFPKTVQLLQNSHFQFFLTGSRYFGTHTEKSDWDFFVERNPGLEEWLQQNGFHVESVSYDKDPVITQVWKKDEVHIQVVICAKAKMQVQRRLEWIFVRHKPSKDEAKLLWALGMTLYRDGLDGATSHNIKSF